MTKCVLYASRCARCFPAISHDHAIAVLVDAAAPYGYVVHHECEVRGCVNPAHLRAMPRGDHQRLHGSMAGAQAIRAARQRAASVCSRGHAYADHAYKWRGRRYCRACQKLARAIREGAAFPVIEAGTDA